jgi:hypothetical protein
MTKRIDFPPSKMLIQRLSYEAGLRTKALAQLMRHNKNIRDHSHNHKNQDRPFFQEDHAVHALV